MIPLVGPHSCAQRVPGLLKLNSRVPPSRALARPTFGRLSLLPPTLATYSRGAMPPRRMLKATPSCADDLCDFQRKLLSDIKALHDDLREKRQPFLEVAQTYAKSFSEDRSVIGREFVTMTGLGWAWSGCFTMRPHTGVTKRTRPRDTTCPSVGPVFYSALLDASTGIHPSVSLPSTGPRHHLGAARCG